MINNSKKCTKCGFEKNLTEFKPLSSKNPDKLRARCIICVKEDNKIYDDKNYDTIYERNKNYRENNQEKVNEMARNSYKNNKEKRSEAASRTYQRNKVKIIARRKVFAQENPDKITERKKRASTKRAAKIENRIHSSVSVMINRAIKNSGGSKNNSSILNFLQYEISELKAHIESQFEPWMNWDNWGRHSKNKKTWQIDHIIPRIQFLYDSMDNYNFQKCWALCNLRPLSAEENAIKTYKISDELRVEVISKINSELEMRAELNDEFKIKLEEWKRKELQSELDYAV